MKKYYLCGLISGVLIAAVVMNFGFRHYYVFVVPNEAGVHLSGLRDNFRLEQFSEVNDFLGNLPGGRRAFIYPTSDSSYSIVYLPRKNRHLDQIEREEISKIIREKMRY